MPFQPGQSGNPGGARIDKIWRDAIRHELAEAEREDKPYSARKLARVFLAKCAEGDMAALKEFGDRTDGKPAQTIGGDPDGAPVTFKGVVEFIRSNAG